jgi:hypothetical protein
VRAVPPANQGFTAGAVAALLFGVNHRDLLDFHEAFSTAHFKALDPRAPKTERS